ncbi:phosphatidate cytidylyltransferase [Candidatus Aerophobetes bacterium]|uniref:Phosphatidate cytidylyltransferase n=1 Tax=Aerophobetes bacterium TaxID=2030807 RepID=A0A523RSM4_UNCAE|nr:MAG: phosphatidate cytidylyltransferase [Candidatus Aerophobetes bacterium]
MPLKRIIIALIFIPLLIFFILRGGIVFLGLVCIIIGGGLFEFYQGMKKEDRNLFLIEGICLGLVVPVSVYLWGEGILPLILTLSIFFLFLRQFLKFETQQAFINISLTLGGILYISVLFSYILILRNNPPLTGAGSLSGAKLVMTVFFVTWMADTSAYFIGGKWGRHKLFPRFSPYKSLEGLVGAVLVSCIAMFISQLWLSFSLTHTLILGISVGIIGQMGDFFESMLKREVKIKDFGKILPGHGGVLDRFDSLLFTIPFFYYYIKYLL